MQTIKQLDAITVNKIAAGEVIDRPVSIVKECLENALDAGATSIVVSVQNGGIDQIKLTDNGHGISKLDLPFAPIRHATSKINQIEDIYNTDTFGFRGEALASICHCAKLTIQSRHQSADKGYEITAYHDTISTPEICAHSTGTTIDIRDLFSDLPVRRKFLKSPATELSYITEIVMQFALVHPDKDFTLISNGQEKINSKGLYKHEHLLVKFYGKN